MNRVLPLLFLGLIGCSLKDGNGEQSAEFRDIEGFTSVRNASSIPMIVDVGPDFSVEVLCDENLLGFIETRLRSDTLELSHPTDTAIAPEAVCEVAVTMPVLDRVHASSNGDIEAVGDLSGVSYVRISDRGDVFLDGIDTSQLRLINQSRGQMVLTGVVDVLAMSSAGAGGIDAGELVATIANISNTGDGDITANVTDHATVSIQGEGDVVIYGDPEVVEVDDDGCGDVY